MPFIGNKPSAVPLTNADITDGIITSAKIANDAVVTGKIADGTIVNADINASAGIVTSKLSGALGITEADQWRLTASFDDSSDITSNLERIDTSPQGKLGTGMTESSGIFTFPSTGFYLVKFNVLWLGNGDSDIRQAGGSIKVTTNNSTYSIIAEAYNGTNNHGANYYMSSESNTILDITDLSNQKVKFNAFTSVNTLTCVGSSSVNETYMTFIRLGDT
jgi:hypothetical protein